MFSLQHLWARTGVLTLLLSPLAALFVAVSGLRRLAYRRGWLTAISVGVPVIIVGNLTAGGSGKTPLTIWLVNWLRDYTEVSSTGTVDDRTGKVTCDVCDFTAYPEWRMNFNAVLSRDNWSVGFAWRYIDGMDIEDGIGVEGFTFTTPAVHYFDLYGTYDWQGFNFMVGAENLGDRDPPYVPSIANNSSTIYDYLGRTFFARATYRF